QFNIGNTPEEIYRGGMEFYSTMLHEMSHSTMTPERLNREMGGHFGDPKYAKEELVAELTAAMICHSMGFDRKVTDNSAAYLDSWIGVLKQEPKFIVSVMADVNKASDLILDQVDKQRLALNEQPYLTKNDPFAPLGEGEEVPFKNAAIVKTRNGDYAIRASYDGVELGLKKVSKDTAKTYFQLTDYKDKAAFLNMTAHKTFEPELAMMQRTQKTGAKMGI
ncbi:DNA primase, partial [Bacteroides ovatus]